MVTWLHRWTVTELNFKMSSQLSITCYSTALFSTWVFVEPFGVLFDCGDGVTSHLLQKGRKVKNVFVSHADRDHLGGLFQFLQLNGRPELTVHFPRDCGSFPAIEEFTKRFDPHSRGTRWVPLVGDETIEAKRNVLVRPVENRHVSCSVGVTKSLSYVLEEKRSKLKPAYASCSGAEIAALRTELGVEAILDERIEKLVAFSGDMPVENDGRFENAKVLIHEATFLNRSELEPSNRERNLHSSLDSVMEMVGKFPVENLVLTHFSSRYDKQEIDDAIERERLRNDVAAKIHVVYPGELSRIEIG